jgi:hypothetical protein
MTFGDAEKGRQYSKNSLKGENEKVRAIRTLPDFFNTAVYRKHSPKYPSGDFFRTGAIWGGGAF